MSRDLRVTFDPVCFLNQKGAGYHLDLFWVAVLLVVCSFMGLPWYVAATVISIAHIDSLKMETETSAPGEQPKFLGVRSDSRTPNKPILSEGFYSCVAAPPTGDLSLKTHACFTTFVLGNLLFHCQV